MADNGGLTGKPVWVPVLPSTQPVGWPTNLFLANDGLYLHGTVMLGLGCQFLGVNTREGKLNNE